jgi:hypothetical protein
VREIESRDVDNGKIMLQIGEQIFVHMTKTEAKEVVRVLKEHVGDSDRLWCGR